MNASTSTYAAQQPHWRIAKWIARAWARLGWRHIVLAATIEPLSFTFGPAGGVFFFPGPIRVDLIAQFLAGDWLPQWLPLIFAALVADAAYDDGVPARLAYSITLVVSALAAPYLAAYYARFLGVKPHSIQFFTMMSPASSARVWTLECAVVGPRLQLVLWAEEPSSIANEPPGADSLVTLRERLAQLYGGDAHLVIHHAPLQLVFDLPRLQEEPAHDDRIDR